MSYFRCAHGETYHPFGSSGGSMQWLVQQMRQRGQADKQDGAVSPVRAAQLSKKHQALIARLESSCPYHSLPLISRRQVPQEEGESPQQSDPAGVFEQIPPAAEVDSLHSDIASSVLTSILQLQINAQLVSGRLSVLPLRP